MGFILKAFSCNDIQFILNMVAYLFKIIQWIIPIFLIILITIDVAKIIINTEDKNKNETMSKIGKRLIYAIILFLVPFLIKIIFSSISGSVDTYDESWISCFNSALNG